MNTNTAEVLMESEIKIEDVSIHFPDKEGGEPVRALQNITLDIKQGEFITLVGPSGCGKTTLLRTIADLQSPRLGIFPYGDSLPGKYGCRKSSGSFFKHRYYTTGEPYAETCACPWN